MRARKSCGKGQEGFSMIEMLMTAFILAVGLLGLCMLQIMSLRGSRGSQSLTTAVHVATGVLDEIEMEGRLSWANIGDSSPLKGQDNSKLGLQYLTLAKGKSTNPFYFNIEGNPYDQNSTDPLVKNQYFTVVVKRENDVGNASGFGQVSDFTATVTFYDTVDATQTKVPRQVILYRRITHG